MFVLSDHYSRRPIVLVDVSLSACHYKSRQSEDVHIIKYISLLKSRVIKLYRIL